MINPSAASTVSEAAPSRQQQDYAGDQKTAEESCQMFGHSPLSADRQHVFGGEAMQVPLLPPASCDPRSNRRPTPS